MVKRLALAAILCAGCREDAGRHYLLQVTPTPRAQSSDTLLVTMRRTDRAEERSFRAALRADLVPPWLLDVRTGNWGGAPISVTAETQTAGLPTARGSGTPSGELIAVALADVELNSDASVDDLAPLSDLLSLPDLITDLSTPDLVPLPDLSCPVVLTQGTLLADASIVSSNPTLNFGVGGVVNVSSGLTSQALLGFDIHTVPVGAQIRAIRLKLSYAKNASDCAPGCGSCDAIEKAGLLTLFYLRSDWVENQCTWNMATSAASWGAPGATLLNVDRSPSSAAMVSHAVLQDVLFDVDPSAFAALATWRSGDQISFIVAPSNGATFIFTTKEWAVCPVTGTVPSAPKLEIDYCP